LQIGITTAVRACNRDLEAAARGDQEAVATA
jgi:hypothetical protein